MRIFSKTLTKDDVQLGLTLPAASQWNLLIPEGNDGKEFRVKDAATRFVWSFRLLIQTSNVRRRLIFSGGWLEFVRRRHLQPGDKVTLYSNDDEASEAQYIIKVQLEIMSFFGKDTWMDLESDSKETQPKNESMMEAYAGDLSNDSHYQIDFLSALASSSENGNADVFYGSNMREDTGSHPNLELSLCLLPETEHIIDIKPNNDVNYGTHPMREGWSRKVNLEWIFVITNFVLELPTAVFNQLSTVHKPKYALISMLMSFITMFVCIVLSSFIKVERKELNGGARAG